MLQMANFKEFDRKKCKFVILFFTTNCMQYAIHHLIWFSNFVAIDIKCKKIF